MIEYIQMKKTELETLLKARSLSPYGLKDILIARLEDSDIFPRPSSSKPEREGSTPLPENFSERMKNFDPRIIANILRRLVHDRNLRNMRKAIQNPDYAKRRPSWNLSDGFRKLDSGNCLVSTCPLCGSGTLFSSLNSLLGWDSRCIDKTCKDFNNCYGCRSALIKLEETFIQLRERESCVDGSCADFIKCSRCEKYVLDAMVPLSRPDGNPGPLRRGNSTQLREVLTNVKSMIHNEYLGRLLSELQCEDPNTGEWIKIKEKLRDGKCLDSTYFSDSTCSSCGTATVAESLEDLSQGLRTDCGGDGHFSGNGILTCFSCFQILRGMEDDLSRMEHGTCISGRCANQEDETSGSNGGMDVERICPDECCSGIKTRLQYEHVQEMEKMKQDEQARHAQRIWLFERLGQCEGPDPEMPYGLGCRFLNCRRCGMIEASVGPKMRNDELRRRRVKNTSNSLDQSSDRDMTGQKRKRRSSNIDLYYPLSPDHILAKRIREEKHRELLQRQQAHSRNERPSWFGTPEDPLPDFWMGRPVLAAEEIRNLKLMISLPRYYLSQSEEDIISFNNGAEQKRLCTIIRRLEAELMSRDFWMQSLGYEADDGNGNYPAGDYRVENLQNSASQEVETSRVENWLSTVPKP
ncbi:hypothetical protein E4T50_11670 [Aureobasidium sp. EXF-12298]|nr:hypothetical protein E4T50_11670 [Aureobasidium sp. EXF-12298]